MKRQELIDSLPMGMTRCVARILSYHIGRENAITKSQLASQLRNNGYQKAKDIHRKIRVAIHELRRSGMLICTSSSGKGYWIASDWNEAQDFIGEMKGRGLDILETARKLEDSACKKYEPQPLRMF